MGLRMCTNSVARIFFKLALGFNCGIVSVYECLLVDGCATLLRKNTYWVIQDFALKGILVHAPRATMRETFTVSARNISEP